MHGTIACLDMESLMLAAQMMTPISSWALAQIFLLGHEVPWTAVRRSEFGRYSIPMGKHQMTPIWFAPHTRHPPWVSHPHRKHSQEGAPRMKGQQHTQELRIPPVALEAILIQGSCNPQHSFSKPAGKAIIKAKSINRSTGLPPSYSVPKSKNSCYLCTIKVTEGLYYFSIISSTLVKHIWHKISLKTDQVIAKGQCKVPIDVLVYSSKMWWMGANMSNITNWDIPEIIWSVPSVCKQLH